ncbi:MAG: T9SS type A sorting domain-containing protein [Bacteroidales bacterium]|nr:T9SS type A sorting domain-containing protein [Bacteroidales bacterium]
MQIYPNPTHDILHVETADNQYNLSYQVYDIYGKLLQ